MNDPYIIPGTDCLRNKLDVDDAEVLRRAEARIVSVRDVEIARTTIPGEYNSSHLQKFHRSLFQDVYEWAGKFRTVDISKDNVRFAHWAYLEDQVSVVLSSLTEDNWLTGMARERFVEKLAFYYGELNARHPFREGNGLSAPSFGSWPRLLGIALIGRN